MKKLTTLSLIAVAACSLSIASADIYSFDELPITPSLLTPIPAGYAGVQWQNMFYISPYSSGIPYPSGYHLGVVNSPNVAYGGDVEGTPAVLSVSSGTFNINYAYLTGAWRDGLTVQAQGFYQGTMIFNKSFIVNSTGPSSVSQFNFIGIDSGCHPIGSQQNMVFQPLKISIRGVKSSPICG